MSGFVSLIGAGPGDPELLTLKAARRLAAAELVLYDALVDPGIVTLAGRAQRFCVGKRARHPIVDQSTIDKLMIRGARRGQRVVRLKCGDPFVLGRGGEEALALSASGVPFEIVPGVTAAVAAPALVGIPVTHRGLASGFLVVSGHSDAVFGPLLEDVTPHSITVVVLMGMSRRRAIADCLLRYGWRSATPVAVIVAAGTPRIRTWIGRLDQLGDACIDTRDQAPGTIVIGDVVGLRSSLLPLNATDSTAEALAVGQRVEV